jgi:hypothetical protein
VQNFPIHLFYILISGCELTAAIICHMYDGSREKCLPRRQLLIFFLINLSSHECTVLLPSLFLQANDVAQLCRRTLIAEEPASILERHGEPPSITSPSRPGVASRGLLSLPTITFTAEIEQLKKIVETTNADINQLVPVITIHGERPNMKTMIRLRPPQPSSPTKPEL